MAAINGTSMPSRSAVMWCQARNQSSRTDPSRSPFTSTPVQNERP